MVLSYHCTNYSFNFLEDDSSICFFLRYYIRTILSCCVPIFFFVNGYLLLNRDFNLKKHINKIIRLVLLTIIWGVIELFLLMYIRNEFLSAKNFIKGLWNLKQGWINHLWFMQALIAIYLLFPLIKVAYDNRRDIFYFFLFVCAILTFGNVCVNVLASIVARLVFGVNIVFSYNMFSGFNVFRGVYGYAFVYFCIGGIADEVLNKFNYFKRIWQNIALIIISMFGLFVIGVIFSYMKNDYWDVVWNGYDTIFTFINVICFFSLCKNISLKDNWFRRAIYIVSSNTLGIFFIHVLFNQYFKPYIKNFEFISNIYGNIIYTFIILFISLVTVLIIKKIPLLKNLVM